MYGGGASWLRWSVFGHTQAPICLVWVVLLSSWEVFLYSDHLYICYGAAPLSVCLIGGGLLLLWSTMLSLSDSCPVAYRCKVMAPTFVSCYLFVLLFFCQVLSCYPFAFLSYIFSCQFICLCWAQVSHCVQM